LRYSWELGASFSDKEAREGLPHYYSVLSGSHRPRYRLAKRFVVDFSLDEDLPSLLDRHRAVARDFWRYVQDCEAGSDGGTEGPQGRTYLDLKAALADRIMEECALCEWRCGVDRRMQTGFCRLSNQSRVSNFFLHHGEEPPLSGRAGSGTIFFTGCNFRCAFCQNHDISQDASNGVDVDSQRLASMMKALSAERCLNFNLVGGEPTPDIPVVLSALSRLEEDVPVLWNSNMYLSNESMDLMRDIVDIWLPDFKYGNDACAVRLSHVGRYVEVVSRNHMEASRYGDMIVRVLLLPGHWDCCGRLILDWLSENLPRALVNIMDQYHPDYLVPIKESLASINKSLSSGEFMKALAYADEIGIKYRSVIQDAPI
jgi:putative pyruvate formate lyase activating enzyme